MKVNYQEGYNLCIEPEDLDKFREMGFSVEMHTTSYIHGIGVVLPDGTSIGFHCWMDNAECWMGDERVKIVNEEHLQAILNLMQAVVKVNSYGKV